MIPINRLVMESAEDIEAFLFFEGAGINVEFTGSDEEGMLTAVFEEICSNRKPGAIFVRSVPGNAVLSDARRSELIRIAVKYAVPVISFGDESDMLDNQGVLSLSATDHQGMLISVNRLSHMFLPFAQHHVLIASSNVIRCIREKVIKTAVNIDLRFVLGFCRLINNGDFQKEMVKVRKYCAGVQEEGVALAEKHLGRNSVIRPVQGQFALWIRPNRPLDRAQVASVVDDAALPRSYNNRPYCRPRADMVQTLTVGLGEMTSEKLEKFFTSLALLEQNDLTSEYHARPDQNFQKPVGSGRLPRADFGEHQSSS